MTMLENLSSYKQKPTKTKAIYKTLHPLHKQKYVVHKNKNTRFILMTALLSDDSVLTKQSIPFSFNRSLSYPVFWLLLLFSNPNSTLTFSSSPMGLLPPQPTINFIISSILYCMRIPLFSWLFFILICSIFLTFSIHVVSGHCLDDQKSLLLQFKSNLKFNTIFVYNTGALECSSWLLFLGRCNLQQWKLQQGTRYWSQSEQQINLCWTWLFK